MLDSQTIKTSANVHLAVQGTNAGKRIIGRKCHLGCDTLGLLLTVLVTAVSVSDTAAGVTLLSRIATAHPHITKAWVDAGYRTTAIGHDARLGIDVHPVHRPPGTRGFTIIPRRWTIERSIGWLMHHRRLTRDHETHPHRFRSHDPPRDDRPHGPQTHRRSHPELARNLTQDHTQIHGPNPQSERPEAHRAEVTPGGGRITPRRVNAAGPETEGDRVRPGSSRL